MTNNTHGDSFRYTTATFDLEVVPTKVKTRQGIVLYQRVFQQLSTIVLETVMAEY